MSWLEQWLNLIGDIILNAINIVSQIYMALEIVYPNLGLLVMSTVLMLGIMATYLMIEYEPDRIWLKAQLKSWLQKRQPIEGEESNEAE